MFNTCCRRITICLVMILVSRTVTFADDAQSVREWLDNTGTYSVEARLLPNQSDGQQVTLQLSDGKTVSLPLRRLSRKDREFIASVVKYEEDKPATKLVNGIEWLSDLNVARKVAAGGPSADDDRPILCFRTLGELSGFM